MAKQPLNGVLQHLRKVAAVHASRELSDGELLERFVGARDEAAVTVLIERHGPMVHGVCRRALPNFHDAEDACQATFLVLARRAASIRKKTSLSTWLHGVAYRVVANMKRDHARRKARECGVDAPAPKDPAAEVSWREVQAILDEELQGLPERYRAPLILCYLECLTRDEAAQRLGLSSTTLHGRLERARDLLRKCLTRRGLTLAAVMSAAALGEGVAQAALASRLVVCAGLFVAMIGGSFISLSIAQEAKPVVEKTDSSSARTESDADFIRRISKDLRGTNPTPAEIHFFVASRDAGRRQKLIDLFIQERHAKAKSSNRGPTTSINIGDVSCVLPFTFPSAEEVLRGLPTKARPKNARIQCKLVSLQFDEPRFYPLVGPARLAHTRFKCTVFTGGGSELVLIGRDHLIPQK
jgi:RNA polymerase sigma factor (sigma-70 family)